MVTVNIFDNTCQHHLREDGYWTSTANKKPKNIQFVQRQNDYEGITLFTDEFILGEEVDKVKSKLKIAWCLESPAVQPLVHNNIDKVAHKFDYILTYRNDLIALNPKKFIPNSPGGTYIKDDEYNLYKGEKNKNCSIILSGKQQYKGHILRHQIYNNCVGIDGYGWGTQNGFLQNKIEAFKTYMFSIVIENIQMTHYFTEKLIDCLLSGCIPIYWGPPNIKEYFNTDGFILFNSYEDLLKIKLSRSVYEQKLKAVEENFNLAKQYTSSDDFLATKLIKLM